MSIDIDKKLSLIYMHCQCKKNLYCQPIRNHGSLGMIFKVVFTKVNQLTMHINL